MHYLLVGTLERLNQWKDRALPPGINYEPTLDQQASFYASLGITIATCQFVESQLFSIFIEVLEYNFKPSLSAAFFSVPNFRGRLSMVDAALEASHRPDAIKNLWPKLQDRCVKRSQRRNTLAHAVVVYELEPPPLEALYLRPDPENYAKSGQKAFPTPQSDKIGLKELVEMKASFAKLHSEMQQFTISLMEERTQRPNSAPPPA